MANISTSTNCNISFTDQEKGILQKASEICKNIGHELWHSGNTDEAEPVPDPPAAGEPARKSRGGGRKVSIDYGKIMALRDAKWSNKDIAEEMGDDTGIGGGSGLQLQEKERRCRGTGRVTQAAGGGMKESWVRKR